MKKLLAVLAAAALILVGTTPAKADVSYFDEWQWWNGLTLTQSSSIAVSGSLREGDSYQIVATGTTPGGASCQVAIKNLGDPNNPLGLQTFAGSFNFSSITLTAGSAGTS